MENAELADILMRRSYLVRTPDEEPFILSSGKPSRHYFDVERTTSYAPALPLMGKAIYDRLLPEVVCVGGPTRGADPMADAVAYYSTTVDHPIHAFSIRRDRKKHGIPGWIEGSAQPGDHVAFIDDVVTTGGSVEEALRKCREHSLVVVQVIVMVDREEGGLKVIRNLVDSSVPVEALFTYGELLDFRDKHHGPDPHSPGPRPTAGVV
jgi:orotate phosphoribosyltransferase